MLSFAEIRPKLFRVFEQDSKATARTYILPIKSRGNTQQAAGMSGHRPNVAKRAESGSALSLSLKTLKQLPSIAWSPYKSIQYYIYAGRNACNSLGREFGQRIRDQR
ncbi:hypothetical protein Y032_0034g2900 [Ancylostoma ceylanicum]|uniref:Uncharacterized protein n=1 Tax=Ancylostoma ceylanicum TaxID=53326 RepID=A0A016UMY4_9BILA|nr:hypothetical protein Y032_0034g2900 [Ancylostoma ceylanicum]